MPIIEKIMQRLGYAKRIARRDYDIARIDRLTNTWKAPITTGDTELKASLAVARARSRELERNNDYAKKYLQMCEINVVGRAGFTLQNKARDFNGRLDKAANDLIETEWWKWGKKGICTVDGRLSWLGVQKLFIRVVARDGEFLARKVRGFDNPWRFALQILEPDLLNEGYNREAARNQNAIRLGVEYDSWGRPVAYHLRKKHPGDSNSIQSAYDYERVPAAEIIHCFTPERSTQGRGIPWMHTAARRLNQIGEYEYAEVVAARLGASKMGFFEKTDPTGLGTYVGDDKAADGNPISNAEPGIFEALPAGYKFSAFLPDHPTAQYSAFIKGSLRGVSSGLGVSYNSLANDLEGVNFSSMRVGAIEERDNWKEIQTWMVDDFIAQVFEAWLDMALLSGRLPLPYTKFDKFNAPEWRGRIFDWVDPEKDIDAELKCARAGWKSARQIVLERFNMDLEDLYEQIAEDEKLKAKYGITVDLGASAAQLGAQNAPDGKTENDGGNDDE
jgi:lambda family phage portal protein